MLICHSITIVSVLRLEYLIQFSHTDNVTWDYLPIGYWSAVETHVSVIVACLPSIRPLLRHIRDRIFPTPATTSSYYEDNSKNTIGSSKKKNSQKSASSRMWSTSVDKSRISTMSRSRVDKDDFVRLNEYEMGVGVGVKTGDEDRRTPTQSSLESFVSRSFKSNEDIQPLAPMVAPSGQSSGGITVQTDYTVDRSILNQGQFQDGPCTSELTEKGGFHR
jgi:hypothetical protein